MLPERTKPSERQTGPVSKVVGLYQMFLRRSLEHFFPDALLDVDGDRSFIEWDGSPFQQNYQIEDDHDGLASSSSGFARGTSSSRPAPRRSCRRSGG